MSKAICRYCQNTIIENWEEYREKYPEEKYIQCPHCGEKMEIKDL